MRKAATYRNGSWSMTLMTMVAADSAVVDGGALVVQRSPGLAMRERHPCWRGGCANLVFSRFTNVGFQHFPQQEKQSPIAAAILLGDAKLGKARQKTWHKKI
jgi:hypothetical protein